MKKNIKICIAIALIIVVIVVLALIFNKKNKDDELEKPSYIDTLTPEEKSLVKGNNANLDNVILTDSGDKVNVNPNINKEIELTDSIVVDKMQLMCSNKRTAFHANINNISNSIVKKFTVKVDFLDENNNVIHSFEKEVPVITSNSKYILEYIVDQDISNAYDVNIKIK